MNLKKWFVKNSKKDFREFAKKHNISPVIAKLLINRDIEDEDVESFLNPTFENSCHDPFLMKDMDKAVDMIIKAIDDFSHIRIVGDYDQDGNSATMTLLDGLMLFTDNLSYAIPNRVDDGYGISKAMVDCAKEENVDLIITCDNGISAFDAIEYAKSLGMKIIVTDHHQTIKDEEKGEILPMADAVVNPQRSDCKYPFKSLCGAGVAFKVIQGLYEKLDGDKEYLMDLLEYVAMGTVCDVVDLLDENRFFVVEGLKRLNETQNYGIKSLVKETGLKTEINTYALGFIIGPTINASGRLSDASKAIELFLEENIDIIEEHAKELVSLNTERKEMTEKGYEKIVDSIYIEKQEDRNILVLKDESIHESIAGIIAGRVKEKYNRPTLVFTKSKTEGVLKGSGRSIDGYDMYEKLAEVRDLFVSFGGHPMAAGMSIKEENFLKLREELNKRDNLTKEDLIPRIYMDSALYANKIDFDLIEDIDKLEPYGKGNSRPIFGDRNLIIEKIDILGKNQNVLKFNFNVRGRSVEGIMFNDIEDVIEKLKDKFGETDLKKSFLGLPNDNTVDIVYYPNINTFNGVSKLQLIIKDIR